MRVKAYSQGTVLAAALLCAAAPLAAQENDAGGQLLTFGVSQSLSYETNPTLTPGGGDAGAIGTTDLSFRFSDTTRSQAFVFDARTSLRLGDTDAAALATPTLSLSYQIESADSVLSFGGRWTRSDIERAATLTDFLQDDGSVVLPVDFDVLDPTLDGTRTNASINTQLVIGRTRPLEYTLSATFDQTDYSGDARAILDDSQTLTLGTGVRLTLDDATQATVQLTYTQFDQDGGADSDRFALSTNWRRDTARGPLSIGFSASETSDGTRLGINASRQMSFPRTELTFGAGLSRPESGDWQLTGRVNGRYALPEGALTFSAQQQFQAAPDGADRRVTNLQGGWAQRVSPTGQISLNIDFVQSRSDTTTTAQTDLSAAYAHTLTPDWTLNTGVQVSQRREDGRANTQNESLFVSLSRSFTTRP